MEQLISESSQTSYGLRQEVLSPVGDTGAVGLDHGTHYDTGGHDSAGLMGPCAALRSGLEPEGFQ